MTADFCGNWSDGQSIYSIENIKDTYTCSFSEKNIGIIVDNYLLVSQFSSCAIKGGVGVYAPIGDRKSYYALWASLGSRNELGSGIIIKRDKSNIFPGEYNVRYFIREHETPVYKVDIDYTANINIYTGTWSIDGDIIHHGIFLAFDGKYAVAYCDPDDTVDIRILSIIHNEKGNEVLRSRYVKWNSTDICEQRFSNVLNQIT